MENPVITPKMIEAGFAVLAQSGIADDYLESDRELVADIYAAMESVKPLSDPPGLTEGEWFRVMKI